MTDINIADAPHILIAGTTGSGKSVLLHHILNARPAGCELAIIDPKRVDFYAMRKSAADYANNPKDAYLLLLRVAKLMETRYKFMQRRGLVKLPTAPVWVIIDELADIFLSDYGKKIKKVLLHLLQLGRAANIHVIAATQAPNRKVIPAELVLNFTHRVALRCISPIESRQIIGVAGAENLPQYGKALFLTPEGLTTLIIPPPA